MGQNAAGSRNSDFLNCVIALTGWYAAASSHLREKCSSTLMQYWVLLILQTQGAKSIRDLQRLLDVNYTTVAECAATIEARGLVLKQPSEEDLRCLIVEITPKGIAEFEQLDKEMHTFSHTAWQNVPDSERRPALKLFCESCGHMGKLRASGGLVRGDSAFLVLCTQFTFDMQRACSEIPLPLSQAKVLMLLSRRDKGMKCKGIAHALAEKTCEVSKLLSKIEAKRLITRETGSNKREKIIFLTDCGREKATAVELAAQIVFEKHFGWIADKNPLFEAVKSLAEALPR